MAKKKRYKVEAIEWLDAAHSDSYYEEGNRLESMPLIEVGILVGEDKQDLTVCGEVDSDGGTRHSVCIPKRVVRRRWTVGYLEVKDGKVVGVKRR